MATTPPYGQCSRQATGVGVAHAPEIEIEAVPRPRVDGQLGR